MASDAVVDPGTVDAVSRLLRERFGASGPLEPLAGGMWSRAYGFAADGRRLVLRLGGHAADYGRDELAAGWRRPGLPIPAFVGAGDLDGQRWAVTERCDGRPLDGLGDLAAWRSVLPALTEAVAAIGELEPPGEGFGLLGSGEHRSASWREHVLAWLEDPGPRLAGWEGALRGAGLEAWYRWGVDRVADALDPAWCHRRVVHTDLGAGNVLVEGDRLGGIIDWGNVAAGDPAADVGHLTYWAPWHPGCPEDEVRRALGEAVPGGDVPARIRAWELVEALDAVRWCLVRGDRASLPEGLDRAAGLGLPSPTARRR